MIVQREEIPEPWYVQEARDRTIDCCVYCVVLPVLALISLSPLLLTAWGIKALYDRATYT